MPDNHSSAGRDRPFPWLCTKCKAKEVYPQKTDYLTTVKHDERLYTIRVPDLSVPTCRKCRERVFAVGVDAPIFDALRAQAGLMTPQDIQQARAQLELSQEELAEMLGLSPEMISSWEQGGRIQSRAVDNLLRLFFQSQEGRDLLERRLAVGPRV